MSSGRVTPPLQGVIRQGDRIVGGFELSDPPELFIEQFNQQYAHLGLRAEIAAAANHPNGDRFAHRR